MVLNIIVVVHRVQYKSHSRRSDSNWLNENTCKSRTNDEMGYELSVLINVDSINHVGQLL